MSSPSNTPTWEQSPPHRPGTSDLINGLKVNDPPGVAVTATMPAAEEFNQFAAQLVALGAVCPVLIVSIVFTAGTPAVQSFTSVRTDLAPSDITVTDNGTGDTSITVAAGKFPAAACRPTCTLNDTLGTNRAPSIAPITNGARVKTSNSAAAATDIDFTVVLY